MVSGPVSPKQHARISAAGPATNLVIAGLFLPLAVVLAAAESQSEILGLIAILVGSVSFVNLFLGGFNMVPFPPLDGSKILAYNKPMWAAMLVALVALGYVGWKLGVFHF